MPAAGSYCWWVCPNTTGNSFIGAVTVGSGALPGIHKTTDPQGSGRTWVDPPSFSYWFPWR